MRLRPCTHALVALAAALAGPPEAAAQAWRPAPLPVATPAPPALSAELPYAPPAGPTASLPAAAVKRTFPRWTLVGAAAGALLAGGWLVAAGEGSSLMPGTRERLFFLGGVGLGAVIGSTFDFD